jgi:hypothetical protein
MTSPAAGDAVFSRVAGVALVLVQCVTLAWLELGYVFAAAASGLALLSLWDRLRIEPKQAPHWLWFALLGLILLIKHRFYPETLPDQITFVNTELAYEFARFLIFLQVVQLYVRREAERTPVWPAAVAVASMVFASDVRLNPGTRTASLVLCLAFAALFGLHSAATRRRVTRSGSWSSLVGIASTLLLAIAAAWGMSTAMRRYEEDFESFLIHSGMGPQRVVATGFSGGGELGEISAFKQVDADHVALRIKAARRPGYLRGAAFDQYEGSEWFATSEQTGLLPGPKPPDAGGADMREYFQVGTGTHGSRTEGHLLEFRPGGEIGSRLFLPIETLVVAVDEVGLIRSANGLISRPVGEGGPYAAIAADEPALEGLPREAEERCLSIPDELRSLITPLSAEVFAECRTSSQKIEAVARFFQSHFRYDLRAHAPRRQDAVAYFLTERPPGHCEFFAASGALLLRSAGVPTRYVTGFVAAEQNGVGDFWVARNKDAHAWIEAYDHERREWVTVECTPSSGVPEERAATGWREWLEAQQHLYDEWMLSMSRGGLPGFLSGLLQVALSVPGLTFLTLLAAGLMLWRLRRVSRSSRRISPVWHNRLLYGQLSRADRYARRLGFERRPYETLSSFAARVRAAKGADDGPHRAVADWYDDYVRVRYGIEDPTVAGAALAARLVHLRAARFPRPSPAP